MLTKTLLATKKHLEDVPTGLPDSERSERVATISEAQRKKERALVRKEVERLQGSIQSLCQTANPLGKIMDYVHVRPALQPLLTIPNHTPIGHTPIDHTLVHRRTWTA